jgi:DNA-binding MurR/RpiR family transcriptional regulator
MNLLQLLRANQRQYRGSDAKLVTYLLAHIPQAKEATIQELASAIGVSTATISRFAKKVGFDSFREFSLAFAAAANASFASQNFFGEITDEDDTNAVAQKVFAGAQNALETTLNQLDPDHLSSIADDFIRAKRVGFFGIGGSSIVAFNAYHKFLRTPIDVIAHPDYDIQLMQAVKLTHEDIAVVISHSGRNKDTLLIADKLKRNNVKVIAITSFAKSPLAKKADDVLLSLAEEVNFRSESMSSLIAQITLIDTLFTLVGSRLADDTQAVVDIMRDVIEETRN